ncbi:4'-phosphopantetheinyl transferase family protein [Exiguobacterium sp. BMC-KP]|uniref:4'-phosphopantetheinyl transferase family protein n=1 Tax=Exiguobacterium sp. BMC-KP TaxID=1684312 RepID=UPI0006AA3522|nr:4'-phosphopantetheinyl transferase superfamily protein [Exiguobacterium sp. BMC-KP]
MFRVYSLFIDDFESTKITDDLILLLSKDRRNKIAKLRRNDDRIRSLYSELFIKYVLHKEFGLVSKDIQFTRDQFSKPLLEGYDNIHFNLSHSGNWIVCAVSDLPIGIDIEKIESGDNRFIEEVLHHKEIEYLTRFEGNEKNTKYYTLWCLKEAYGKYMGVGLNYEYQKNLFEESLQGWVLKPQQSDANESLYFQVNRLPGDYLIAVCTPYSNLMTIKQVDHREIIDFTL